MDEIKLKPCPFCGGKVSLVLCDDEGNLHDEAYREHPYSGLGFMLFHAHEENPECPIASYECDGGILGRVYIYETEEQAAEAWNRRAEAVHGRKIEDGDIGGFWLCSLCGEWLPYGANYCPNCGSKMDLEDENGSQQ